MEDQQIDYEKESLKIKNCRICGKDFEYDPEDLYAGSEREGYLCPKCQNDEYYGR